MRVLIADDQTLVRHAIRTLLEARGHAVVGEAASARETVERAHLVAPDVVLVGLDLPLDHLVALIRELSALLRCTNVVVLADQDDDESLFQVVRAGARGFATKDLSADDFCLLIERAARGESGLTPVLAAKVLDAFARAADEPSSKNRRLSALTQREQDVLERMAHGVTSNRDLAEALGVSENTVRFHMRNILDKLHLHTRAAAVVYALTHGIVETPE